MSSQEVMKVLKKFSEEALSIKELEKHLKGKMNTQSINRVIKTMERYGEVESIQLDCYEARRRFGKNLKRKLKIYVLKD